MENLLEKIEKVEQKYEEKKLLTYYSIFLWEFYIIKNTTKKIIYIFKILYNIFLRIFFFKKNIDKEEYEISFFSFMERDADFGIIFPIVKEFDKRNRKVIFFISEECYTYKKEKLKLLSNTKIIIMNKKNLIQNLSIKECMFILRKSYQDMKKLSELDKNIKENKVIFLYHRIVTDLSSRDYRVRFPHIESYFSLGSPLVGLIDKRKKHYGIQHGNFYEEIQKYYPWFCWFNIDKGYVFGEENLKLKKLYKRIELVSSGNPFYDNLKEVDRRKNSSKINIYFFSALQGREEMKEQLFKFLEDILNILSNEIKLVIKLHPNEGEKIFNEYKNYFKDKIDIIRDKKIGDLLEDIDIALSIDSTSNFEILVQNRIVGQIIIKEWESFIEKQKFSIKLGNVNKLKYLIKNIRKKVKYNKILNIEKNILIKMYLSNLGNASQFIYEDIMKEKEKSYVK